MLPLAASEQEPASAAWWLLVVAAVRCWRGFVALGAPVRRAHGHPLVDFGLLRTRSYALGTLLGLLYFAGFTAIFFVFTLFLQNGRGYTPLEAGLALTPFALGSAVTSAIGGRLVSGSAGRWSSSASSRSPSGWSPSTSSCARSRQQRRLGDRRCRCCRRHRQRPGHRARTRPSRSRRCPPREGGTRGAVLQTGQRIGSAIGISAVGAVFFGQLAATGGDWGLAFRPGLIGTLGFVLIALAAAVYDLLAARRAARRSSAETPPR